MSHSDANGDAGDPSRNTCPSTSTADVGTRAYPATNPPSVLVGPVPSLVEAVAPGFEKGRTKTGVHLHVTHPLGVIAVVLAACVDIDANHQAGTGAHGGRGWRRRCDRRSFHRHHQHCQANQSNPDLFHDTFSQRTHQCTCCALSCTKQSNNDILFCQFYKHKC